MKKYMTDLIAELTKRKYLLLFGLFILVTLDGFSQYQPFDESGLQKIYVSTIGSDSGTGSVDSPYLTVKKALSKAMELKKTGTGVKVIIAAGTYREGVPANTYSLTAEITYAPLVLEGAGWDASNPYNTGMCMIEQRIWKKNKKLFRGDNDH